MTKKLNEQKELPLVIMLGERDFRDLTAMAEECGESWSEFIVTLIRDEVGILSDEYQREFCDHRRLKLSQNGNYHCLGCGMEFEMTIPF